MAKVNFTVPQGKGNPGGQNPGKTKAKGGTGAGQTVRPPRLPRHHVVHNVQVRFSPVPLAAPAQNQPAPATPPAPAPAQINPQTPATTTPAAQPQRSGGDAFWKGMMIGFVAIVGGIIGVWFLACMARPYPNAPLAAQVQPTVIQTPAPQVVIVQPVVQQPAVVQAPPQQAEAEYEPAPVAPVVYERPSAGRTIGAFLGGVAAGAIIDRLGHRSGGYRSGYSSRGYGYGGGYRTPSSRGYGGGFRRGRR